MLIISNLNFTCNLNAFLPCDVTNSQALRIRTILGSYYFAHYMELLLKLATEPGGTLTQTSIAFIMHNCSAEFLITPLGSLAPVSPRSSSLAPYSIYTYPDSHNFSYCSSCAQCKMVADLKYSINV